MKNSASRMPGSTSRMRRTSNSDSRPDDDHRDQARQRLAAGEEHHAEAEQQDADREEEIVEAGHEAEAFVFRRRPAAGAALRRSRDERAQRIGLRLRQHPAATAASRSSLSMLKAFRP